LKFVRPSFLAIAVAAIPAVVGLGMAIYLASVRDPALPNKKQEKSMAPHRENGIVTIPAGKSVDQTVAKLEAILETKGVKLFTLIDQW
jgi:hypothetical protein